MIQGFTRSLKAEQHAASSFSKASCIPFRGTTHTPVLERVSQAHTCGAQDAVGTVLDGEPGMHS